jgi:Ser/Thr protein kinase RdoA (MazF antagonist)
VTSALPLRPDTASLTAAWPFLGAPESLTLTSLHGGTNNTLYRVASAESGELAYVLRLAAPHHNERHAQLEYAVLADLQRRELPFAVPTPLLTVYGAPWANLPAPGGMTRATLTHLIAGIPPDRGNLAQAEAAGAAIGTLDVALTHVTLPDMDAAISWRSAAHLDQINPLVPDPPAAFAKLPIAAEERERLRAGYTSLMERLPALYATLPQQLCHEDTDPGNFLMNGVRVAGILDFEFLSHDIRASDQTVALVWWSTSMRGTSQEWPVIAALARGYARSLRLTAPEIAAIPTLYRMRGYTSLIHRLGRALQGLSPMEHVVARAEAALAWADWLDTNSERLVSTVTEASETA